MMMVMTMMITQFCCHVGTSLCPCVFERNRIPTLEYIYGNGALCRGWNDTMMNDNGDMHSLYKYLIAFLLPSSPSSRVILFLHFKWICCDYKKTVAARLRRPSQPCVCARQRGWANQRNGTQILACYSFALNCCVVFINSNFACIQFHKDGPMFSFTQLTIVSIVNIAKALQYHHRSSLFSWGWRWRWDMRRPYDWT